MNQDTTRATRLAALRRMVDAAGGPAAFARAHEGIDPTYVSQLLNGHRNFGERAARNMEAKLGLPVGALDRPDEGTALPREVLTLLDTITKAAEAGNLTAEQAAAFDQLIKTTTGSK